MLHRVLKSVLGFGLAAGMIVAPLVAQQPQKKVKDQGEYDLYNSVAGAANDPNKQLQLLQTWKEKYPDSDFKEDRAVMVAQDQAKLGKPAEAIKACQDVLAINPKNLTALVTIVNNATHVNPPTPDSLAAGEKAANTLIADIDSMKPAGIKDADWATAKSQVQQLAYMTLGWTKMQQKQNDDAEKAFRQLLTLNGQNGQVSYWLGTILYAQKKFPPALYEFARAASYTGPGALPDNVRASAGSFLDKAYAGYHGSADGLDALKKQAATSALPPDDFKIASITEIEGGKQASEDEFRKAHPDIGLWRTLRDALKADGGEAYFTDKVKDSLVPPEGGEFKVFKGKVVSMENPKEIVISVDDQDGPTGDATLVFEAPIKGKLDPGADIGFAGSPQSFTKDPFMIKFTVDRKNVTGLPAAAPAPVRRPVTKKKQ